MKRTPCFCLYCAADTRACEILEAALFNNHNNNARSVIESAIDYLEESRNLNFYN